MYMYIHSCVTGDKDTRVLRFLLREKGEGGGGGGVGKQPYKDIKRDSACVGLRVEELQLRTLAQLLNRMGL